MNKFIYILIGGAFFALLALTGKEKKGEAAIGEAEKPPPPPPNQGTGEGAPAYQLDDLEVIEAVNRRIAQYLKNPELTRSLSQEAGIFPLIFQGLKYPQGMQNVISEQLGNPFNIPVIPSKVDANYNQKWELVKGLKGFEQLTSAGDGFENANTTWKNALNFPLYGFSLWPDPQDIEAGVFGQTKRGDRNRSERYDAFTKDTKVMAENLQQASRKLYGHMETRAIRDLQKSGWNIVT